MNYILVVARKFANSDISDLTDLIDSLGAIQISQILWEFDSDKNFRELTLDIYHELHSAFDFLLIEKDGSEEDPLPQYYWTNDTYLKFCVGRLKHQPVEGELLPLLETSLSSLSRQENRILNKLAKKK